MMSSLSSLISYLPSLPFSYPTASLSLSLSHMATNTTSLQSLHRYLLQRRHHSETPPSTLFSSLYCKPTTRITSLSHYVSKNSSTHFSLASTTSTTTPTTSPTISFDLLRELLSSKDYRQADEETRRLLIILAGEAAQKRGYVFFSEVKFISVSDLQTIDGLWRQYSDNKFGYSVQKKIWQKVSKDFTRFFIKVRWMKKLETEIVQYNYRSFPTEFIWELTDETPEGHLPLTNALRGTQLLNSILCHPAFQSMEEEEDEEVADKGTKLDLEELRQNSKPFSKRNLKTDYSF